MQKVWHDMISGGINLNLHPFTSRPQLEPGIEIILKIMILKYSGVILQHVIQSTLTIMYVHNLEVYQ